MKMDRLQICFFTLIFISNTAGKTLSNVNGKRMHIDMEQFHRV